MTTPQRGPSSKRNGKGKAPHPPLGGQSPRHGAALCPGVPAQTAGQGQSEANPEATPEASRLLSELQTSQMELEMQNETLHQTRQALEKALDRYSHLYDFAPVGYFTLRPSGEISGVNLAGARLMNMPRSRLINHPFTDFIEREDLDLFNDFLASVFRLDWQQNCEVTLLPNSRRENLCVHIEAIQDEPLDECRLVVTDITETKRNEIRLKLAASVFSHSQEGIMIMDADGQILDVNHSFCAITGRSREAIIGNSMEERSTLVSDPDTLERLWQGLESKGHWTGEIQAQRGAGEPYFATLKITEVNNSKDEPKHYVVLLSDITALKNHQRKLEQLAHYDALTGLPNRVLLSDRLHHAMAQARRRGNFMALVYLDLDGFKAVNDTHGHKTGDLLLIEVTQKLKHALREGDTLARLGGDEFVAILADLASQTECDTILQRLLSAASTPVYIDGLVLNVSASLGVTLSPQDPGDADILLRHADMAMYHAKQAGKNRYHLFDPAVDLHARSRFESLRRISQGLEQREFLLHYQPIVDIRAGRVVGVEALLRWQHPERGLLGPDEFLTGADDPEIAGSLDDWVLDAALDQLADWQASGLNLKISVNLSPQYLQQARFAHRLRDKLDAHPSVSPAKLQLEVVETAAISQFPDIAQIIADCQALGVAFSLDDFGTGYSSLTYLKRLPTHTLKIDCSFVRDMLWDIEDLAIVEGVIVLAQAFNRQVVAEGVETLEHARMLLRLGCDLIQGNGIAPPLPASAIPGWAADWQPRREWSDIQDPNVHRHHLPLIYAEVNHRQWFRQLDNYLGSNGETPPSLEASENAFQRWYTQDGQVNFGHLPEYPPIGALHERILNLGQALVQLKQGQTEHSAPAEQALPGTWRELEDELRALEDQLLDQMQHLTAAAFRAAA